MRQKNRMPKDLNLLDEKTEKWWVNFEQSCSTNWYGGNITEDCYTEVISRASEISPDTLMLLSGDETLSGPFSVRFILDLVDQITDVAVKLEFLQIGMSTWPKWDDVSFDGFHVEFLELMWKVLHIVDQELVEGEEVDELLSILIERDSFWEDPIVMSAIVALKTPSSAVIMQLLDKFFGIWDADENELIEDNDLDIELHDLPHLAPLIAIAILKTDLPREQIQRILEITTWSGYEEFSLCIWEYISACISKGNQDSYWAPNVIWREGFFSNGIWNTKAFSGLGATEKEIPLFNLKAELNCLLYFFDNQNNLSNENPYGEQTIQRQVLLLLLNHPEATTSMRLKVRRALKEIPEFI